MRLDRERPLVEAVDEHAARLVAPPGPRPSEARRGREHARPRAGSEHLEVAPLADRCLVGVPADDQLGSRIREPRKHAAAGDQRQLAHPPRRPGELVVDRNQAKRARRSLAEQPLGPLEVGWARSRPRW